MRTTAEFCYVLDGAGGAKEVPLKSVSRTMKNPVWVHIDYADAENQAWLKKQRLSPAVLENLLDSDTTPRYFQDKKGALIVMRGVNVNENAEDDMITLHIWMTKNRLLTLSHRSVPTITKVCKDLKRGNGPLSISDCFVKLAHQMIARIENTLIEMNDEGDVLEDAVITETTMTRRDIDLRQRLSVLRHKVVGLRRYLVPQRDMMTKLVNDTTLSLFEDYELQQLQEVSRDLTTIVSELDFMRDHSSVTQEELDSRTNIDMSRTMYVMSLIMVVFTPLTFLTGLLGANVGGIPFGSHPYGFLAITLILIVFAIVQMWIIKKLHWF